MNNGTCFQPHLTGKWLHGFCSHFPQNIPFRPQQREEDFRLGVLHLAEVLSHARGLTGERAEGMW